MKTSDIAPDQWEGAAIAFFATHRRCEDEMLISTYQGIEFSVKKVGDADTWQFEYAIDGEIKTGLFPARNEMLASREVWALIDDDLRSRPRRVPPDDER